MYICLEKKESGDNALYYFEDIGRRRIYRQTYPVPQFKGLRLFTYKNKKNAQKICDYTNKEFGANYQAVELGEEK